MKLLLLCLGLAASVHGLSPIKIATYGRPNVTPLASMTSDDDAAVAAVPTTSTLSRPPSNVDSKEAVKIFGRLAEKYIMLDESGGMCCYSGCKDCEYRLPDGGYRMADQSSARPKWIPVYEERNFASTGKEHVAKWKTALFGRPRSLEEDYDDGDEESFAPSISQDDFVAALVGMEFVPPLGGPFVSKTAATMEDTVLAKYLFEILAGGKEKLSRHKMSLGLKAIANGEQGLTWVAFLAAVGLKK